MLHQPQMRMMAGAREYRLGIEGIGHAAFSAAGVAIDNNVRRVAGRSELTYA
jgi:hypothetical protein